MKRVVDSGIENSAKVLTESEIQEKLYGEYFGLRRKGHSPEPGPLALEKELDGAWTGSEILSGELERLRCELITLREERERLAQQLLHYEVQKAGNPSAPKVSGWVGAIAGIFILIGMFGFPMGFRLLQASPVLAPEPSPYTVQVAVYDIRRMADRGLNLLQELGYPAFLVEFPHQSGRSRYRIYVGRFVTKIEAEQERERLSVDPRFSDAFVRMK